MKKIKANLTSDTMKSMIDANLFDEYIKNQNLADESLINFLGDAKYKTKDLANFQEYLKNTSGGMSTFANFAKKAGSVIKSFGASLASMAVNWAIGIAIQAAITWVDSLAESLDEQKEALETYKNTIQGYESEMDSLQSKIDENDKKIAEINNNPLNIVDRETLSTLQSENSELKQQLETIRLLNDEAKELSQKKILDILGNTSEINNFERAYKGLISGDFSSIGKAYFGANGVYGGFTNGIENLKNGNLLEGAKDIAKGSFSLTPLGTIKNIYNVFSPKKENEQTIFEETEEQIENVKKLQEDLKALEKQRPGLSDKEYEKSYNKITKNLTDNESSLVSNIQALKDYKSQLDETDPTQAKWIEEIQDTMDLYTASMAHQEGYNTFDEIINSDVYGSDKEKLMELAEQGALTEELLDEEYHNLFVLFNELGFNIDDIVEKLRALREEEQSNPTTINFDSESFLEAVSSIQSGYEKLLSAQEEYQEYGAITASTLKDLMDNNLIQYLQYTADGLSINTSALENNEQALKDAATAELYNAMCNDIQNLSLGNTALLSPIAQTAIANLNSVATTAGANAAIAAQGWWEYGASIQSIPGVSDLTGDNYTKAEAIVNQYKTLANSINSLSIGKTNSSKKSIASTAAESAEEAASAFKNLMEEELKALDNRMDAGLLKYGDYLKQRLALIESYKGKISDADYYSTLSDNYENELSYMDKALNAVKRAIDKKIEAYNDEIEALEEAHDKKTQLIDNEIQKLEDQKDALQDENDAIERQLSLEQSLYDLERAQTQKTKMVYTGDKGYVYTTDQDAIRDAQEAVRQSKLDIQISEIDDAIEKLQEEQEALEEKLDLERETIEKNIEDLEAYQSKWDEITSKYSEDQETMVAIAIWGKDWENAILTDKQTKLEEFTNAYVTLQQQQIAAALASAEAVEESERRKAVANGSDGSNISEPSDTSNKSAANTSNGSTANAIISAGIAGAEIAGAAKTAVAAANGEHSSEYQLLLEALKNLGYIYGYKVDTKGSLSSEEAAKTIKKFQDVFNLGDATGIMNDATYRKLREVATSKEDYDMLPFFANATNKKTKAWIALGRGKNAKWNNLPETLPKYAKGGVISSSHSNGLDFLARQLEEDHIVAAAEGERVLTPVQNEMWEKWTEALPKLLDIVQPQFETIQFPDYNFPAVENSNPVHLNIGDIYLSNVQNVDSLSDAILRELPNKILQRIHKR